MIAKVLRLAGGLGLLTTWLWLLRCRVLLVNHYTARADTGMTGRVGRLCVCRDMRPRVRCQDRTDDSVAAQQTEAWRMRRRSGLASHLDVACVGFLGASTVRAVLRCSAHICVEGASMSIAAATRLRLSNGEACRLDSPFPFQAPGAVRGA